MSRSYPGILVLTLVRMVAAVVLLLPTTARSQNPKWALWNGGTHLRGANIWQAPVHPELEGTEYRGPGPVGPPFTQEDFDRLAAMGANYVNISHPGLFAEDPPYTLDQGI